ncbi:MAG TPA: porin [Burkholderiales bacterium]|nr:porin [Burkholderiales bacterium]
MRRNHQTRGTTLALTALVAALLGGVQPARAQTEIFDDLLEKLRDKGVLSDAEYDALKQARDEERLQQRAERRKQALEAATAAEHEEKAKAEEKTTLKGRFRDGFTFESGDKQHSISVTGRVHADYRSFSEDSTNANSADTFDVRRAYIGLSGKFYNDWTFDVTADVAQTSAPQLDVAWLNWGRYKPIQARAGQFKMPFSLEELTSSRFIDFQERSLVNSLVPAKERGAMLHGAFGKGFFYGAALSNGAGKNANEGNSIEDSKDIIGRLGVNAAEWLGNKDIVLHVAGAYSTGTIPGGVSPVGGGVRTEGRGLTFFNTAAMGAATDDVDRSRTGGEVSVAWGPIKAQGEYVKSNFEWTAGGVGFDQDIKAYYAEAMWLITGEKYADAYRGGAYAAIKPKNAFGSGGWGAWEVGVRYTDFDAEDFAANAGLTNKATAYTVGLKWIPVTNVRFYLNYVQTDFDTPVAVSGGGTTDDEKAITLRAAVYF